MRRTVDYYFSTQSPWTYLGHARFAQIAAATDAQVRVKPVDLGQVFPLTGGLPLAKRAPARQAYRLVELARYARHLSLPMNTQPAFFPVAGDASARLIIATDLQHGSAAAMKLAGAVLAALWAQQRNIADAGTLAALLAECGLPAALADAATGEDVQQRYASYTQQALDAGVFGAPSYVIDGELFWGQDRLEFVERALQS